MCWRLCSSVLAGLHLDIHTTKDLKENLPVCKGIGACHTSVSVDRLPAPSCHQEMELVRRPDSNRNFKLTSFFGHRIVGRRLIFFKSARVGCVRSKLSSMTKSLLGPHQNDCSGEFE